MRDAPEVQRPRRTQEERSRATREALLRAAGQCVCRSGPMATTLAQVADLAGVSKGALQHHFEDKRDLMASVVEWGWGALVPRLRGLSDTEGTITERVDAVVSRMWDSFMSVESVAAFRISTAARGDPALQERIEPYLVQSREMMDREWARLFRDAPADPERVLMARRLAPLLMAGIIQQTNLGIDPPDTAADIDLLKETLCILLTTTTGGAPGAVPGARGTSPPS